MLVLALLRLALLLAGVVVLRRRAHHRPAEGHVWTSHAAAAGVLAAGSAATVALALAGAPPAWTADAFSVTTLPACLLVHHGFSLYHRRYSVTGESADRLVAVSCVLAGVASANLLLQTGVLTSPLHGLELQHRLLTLASVAVVLATLLRVARAGRAASSPPALLLTGSLLSLLLAHAAVVVVDLGESARTAASFTWVAFLAALAHAGSARRDGTRTITTSPLSTTTTAFAALLTAVAVVTATTLQPGDGDLRWSVVWAVLAVLPVAGRVRRLVRDLVDHDRVQREAATDELTGLANRRAFTAALEAATRARRPVSALLIDLDRFKEVNDRYGHATGDRLLQHAGRAFTRALPAGALLARLGGDEFAVLLTDAPHGGDPGRSLEIATRVAGAAGRDPLDGVHRVVASVGVVTTDGLQHLAGEDLLRRADAAMYSAKAGGGGVGVHDDAAARRWRRREVLAADLVAAFGGAADDDTARRRFAVHHDPQVDRDGRTVGVRASLRWAHPALGTLGPADFLGPAEELRLLPELTAHLVTRGCADLARWRAAGHDVRLCVAVPAAQFGDPRLLDLLDAATAGVDPRRLVVGTTGAAIGRDPARATRVCREIDARGCGLSIDDFGTGTSSLVHLASLPVDEVGLGAALIEGLLLDPRAVTVLTATVEFAHRLGLRVVAGGVADATTLALLRDAGCDLTHGPVHSAAALAGELQPGPPVPASR